MSYISPRCIVIIDDDKDFLSTLSDLLGQKYNVKAFDDAILGCQFISKNSKTVALVITDRMMPRLEGHELVKHLRLSGYVGKIILETAFPDDEKDLLLVEFEFSLNVKNKTILLEKTSML